MVTVLYIASNIIFFAITYIKGDVFLPRFVGLMIRFIMSMVLLVILPNLITLLIGWDGLGLRSFLLILYYQTHTAKGAGMLTLLTNRLGDVMLLLLIAWSVNSHWHPIIP